MENENKVVEETKTQVEAAPKADAPVENNDNKGGKRPFNKNFKRNFRGPRRVEVKEYEEKVVTINRVTKVVKGGKRMKFAALVVVGNYKVKYGFATGKSGEVPDAIKKAVERAKRNIKFVKVVKAESIAHEVVGIFGATKVFLKPAPEGTGIVAGGPVRAILELSGIKNVRSKVYGSRTAINVIRATAAALDSLKDYQTVKALRGLEGGNSDVK